MPRGCRDLTVAAASLLLGLGAGMAGAQANDEQAAEPSATDRALGELSAAYESLADLLNSGSEEAVGRVQGDIENLGDWEYKIVDIADAEPAAMEAELNVLGNERWEAYWMESRRDGVRVYLKRQSVSYLSRVPLSTLLRLLAGGVQ